MVTSPDQADLYRFSLLLLVDRWLTLMPSHRDTARKGLKALSVLMERKAGMSAAPAQIAPKLISESYHHHQISIRWNVIHNTWLLDDCNTQWSTTREWFHVALFRYSNRYFLGGWEKKKKKVEETRRHSKKLESEVFLFFATSLQNFQSLKVEL